MKAVVCVKPGVLEFQSLDKPIVQADEVLVKIKSIGICGTDIHAYGGNQPFFNYPRILGHELSGIIDSVGKDVDLPIGSSVYIIPYLSCGECIACRRDKANCCTNIEVLGVHRDGGMCEYVAVPSSAVVITDGLGFNQMAVIECLAIGAHAVRRADIKADDTVLVLGAGPIGLGALQFAKEKGATAFISDIKQDKLALCLKEYDADGIVDATGDVKQQLSDLTNGDFPTVIIDCTGNAKAMESAFYCLAHGGRIVFVSIVKANISFDDPEFHKRETTLLGSRNATLEDFEHVVNCLKSGSVKSASFITHSTHFSGMIEDFKTWCKPETGVIKAVVEMD